MTGRSRQRGVALVSVLMLTVIFLIVIGSMLSVLAMETHAVRSSAESDAALTAAYAGVDAQIEAIENFYILGVGNGKPPNVGKQVFPNESGGTTTSGYDADISQDYSDTGRGQKYYLIQSSGFTCCDSVTGNTLLSRAVTALVQEQLLSSFGQFSDSERSNTGGPVVYSSGQVFDGMVYSGGTMHVVYQPGQPAIFNGGFETASRRVDWYDLANGNTNAPQPGTPEWNAVFGPGASYQTQVSLTLPSLSQNLIVFSEAFAGNSSDNTLSAFQNATNGLKDGIYLDGAVPSGGSGIPLNTGIFVQGDAQMTASATDTSETFQITFTDSGGPPAAKVTIDFTANTTTVVQGGTTTVYNGVASGTPTDSSNGSGAIFVNGNLEIPGGGTIKGQYNVALPDPPTSGQEMTVDGSLMYQFKANPNDTDTTDELALWANDIRLNDQSNANPEIDAMLLTGYVNECNSGHCADGSFFNVDCNAHGCTGPLGTITLFGGLLENIRGKLGELDAQGHHVGGFLRNATYDARLGANPPPDTPTTNQYSIIAIQDNGSL